ncbi:hypothetical protein [Microcella humidisoli]|uniref:Uncharacterized protein n=1 Tax=Microcella humidisoli TaxID=2963406 RepID=A0ABY5FZV5_9MICO|nr:hypothetical protein [Microcella humidisoli]UTT63671.1 hypothetical protein NNL39_06140 [Microcella humidisoli]
MAVRLVQRFVLSAFLVWLVFLLEAQPLFADTTPLGFVLLNLVLLPVATWPLLSMFVARFRNDEVASSGRQSSESKSPASVSFQTASPPIATHQSDREDPNGQPRVSKSVWAALLLIGWASIYVWAGMLASGATPFNGVYFDEDGDANPTDSATAGWIIMPMLFFGNPLLGALLFAIVNYEEDESLGWVSGLVVGLFGAIVFVLLPQYT